MTPITDIVGQDWVFVVRLLIAMFLGSLVGIERQTRSHAAGLRTNILVYPGQGVNRGQVGF